jgi:Mor family transcriptional regulator
MNVDLSRYPEVLRDLIDRSTELIVEKIALPPATAREAAFIVTEVIRKDWSGSNLYLAKGLAHDIAQRDREMYAKFNGSNHGALAKEYGLTTRQVYDRLALVGEAEQKRRQPGLF